MIACIIYGNDFRGSVVVMNSALQESRVLPIVFIYHTIQMSYDLRLCFMVHVTHADLFVSAERQIPTTKRATRVWQMNGPSVVAQQISTLFI